MAFQDLETKIHVDNSESGGGSVRRGCFCFPCFRGRGPAPPAVGSAWWERISAVHQGDRRWWARGVMAFRKVREWSEIVAGPKWKTFIRRLNRNRAGSSGSGNGKFQYDPLSYSLNFDEGQGYNGILDAEEEEAAAFRDFSSRYGVVIGAAGQQPTQSLPVITESSRGDVAIFAS